MSDKPAPGSQVEITKLRFKLLSVKIPDYQIAAACSMHPTTLSNYAQGKTAVSAKHLSALCSYFKCEPEELLGKMLVEIA